MNDYNIAVSSTCSEPIPAEVTLLSVPSGDTQALVCTIEDGHSGTLHSFKWKKNGIELTDYIQGPLQKNGELHSAVSVLKVSNTEWDSKAVYTCEVNYRGMQYTKKASKGAVLSQFSPNSDIKQFMLDLDINDMT